MLEHCTFDTQIFGCGKVYYSNSIIITNFVQTLIPNCWFENVFPTYLAQKSPNNIFMLYLRNLLYTSFQPHYGPGVDSASNRSGYQEDFLGGKWAAGA
jgi:hypothetical protein